MTKTTDELLPKIDKFITQLNELKKFINSANKLAYDKEEPKQPEELEPLINDIFDSSASLDNYKTYFDIYKQYYLCCALKKNEKSIIIVL